LANFGERRLHIFMWRKLVWGGRRKGWGPRKGFVRCTRCPSRERKGVGILFFTRSLIERATRVGFCCKGGRGQCGRERHLSLRIKKDYETEKKEKEEKGEQNVPLPLSTLPAALRGERVLIAWGQGEKERKVFPVGKGLQRHMDDARVLVVWGGKRERGQRW